METQINPSINAPVIGQTKPIVPPAQVTVPLSTYTAPVVENSAYLDRVEQTKLGEQEALKDVQKQSTDISSLLSQLGGQEAERAQQYEKGGVNNAFNQSQDLAAQARILREQAFVTPFQTAERTQGYRGTQGGIDNINRDLLQRNAILSYGVARDQAQADRDYNKAKNLADQQVNVKYAQLEADLASRKFQLEATKEQKLTPAQEKRRTAEQALIKKQEQEVADKKANEKDMQSLALTVAKNGGSQVVQNAIKNAKSFNDAVFAATPFLQSPLDKADLSYKLAQTAKIYADMRNEAATVGSNVAPENMLPFSQEYAATGKIPVGAPKGSAAAIMRYAKELPQAPGSLVSSITGVKNTSLGVEQQSDIARLYNITQEIKELKKLDEKRVGGFVGGTVGKIFGSDAQSAYLTKRKSIVDDISRMQSGAALTEEEVSFYEDYLTGRFSETAGLGQDSLKKIEKFEQAMNEKLKNALNNNQLSIYGYSNIEAPNGQEYKVGDLIQANGVTGRVNPDGTVTIVQ